MKAAQVKLGRIWTFTLALAQVAYLRKDGGIHHAYSCLMYDVYFVMIE